MKNRRRLAEVFGVRAWLIPGRFVLGAPVAPGERSQPRGRAARVWVIAAGALLAGAVALGHGGTAAHAMAGASAVGEPEPGRVALVYELGQGAGGCEGEGVFRQWVEGKMHVDPFVLEGAPTHTLRLRIEKKAPGMRGLAELRDAAGEVVLTRDVLERTCADVVDRLVVVVLLSVFPPRFPAAPPPTPATAPLTCGPCDEAARKERELVRKEVEALKAQVTELHNELQAAKRKGYGRAMDLSFALSAGALITANLTSNVGPGVWLHGEARSGPLALGLELRSVLPAPVTLGPYDFDLSQVVALLTPCGRYSYFFGCAVAGAGVQITYDSSDVLESSAKTGFFPLVQLGGRVGVEVPFGDSPFGARAWGEVLYSTPHTYANYVGTGFRWDRPDVSAFFGMGLMIKLGDEGAR